MSRREERRERGDGEQSITLLMGQSNVCRRRGVFGEGGEEEERCVRRKKGLRGGVGGAFCLVGLAYFPKVALHLKRCLEIKVHEEITLVLALRWRFSGQ